jgi:ubiquinone/menaquinone biosynthesis C-methylase UbiE
VPHALAEIDRVLRPRGILAYEEILHKDGIRSWLAAHGYVLSGIEQGWKREAVVARKAAD